MKRHEILEYLHTFTMLITDQNMIRGYGITPETPDFVVGHAVLGHRGAVDKIQKADQILQWMGKPVKCNTPESRLGNLTNSMAYEIRRFNVAFTKALQ